MAGIDESLRYLAAALAAAAAEHGVPNNFTPGELHAHHGGPAPRFAGLVGSTMNVALDRLLRERGYRLARYAERAFSVEAA